MRRRQFLQSSLAAPAVLSTAPAFSAPATTGRSLEKLRVAVLGTGFRGQSHLDLLLRRDDCVVTAIADIDQRMIGMTKELFAKAGAPAPVVYDQGPEDYLRLLETEDLDAVMIATPWRWHTPMAVAAMRKGRYVGVEVCGAFSLDECWELVRTHEATGSQLFFLENVCYRRDVMAVLNMVRQGLFGELLHLEGGYQHDLRNVKFNDGVEAYGGGVEFGPKAFHEARWRTAHSVLRNGDLYPTHGVGPVANYININRGNRFVGLTSMASKARGLHEYIVNHPKGGPSHPNAKVEFKLGDKVTTLLSTVNGETVVLHHDTNLPRPYSLGFRVQGTKGLWMDVNQSLHLEGTTEAHRWAAAAPFLEKYDHPLWQRMADRAEGAGHGGMDFFLVNAFVEAAKANAVAPIDVYDAATWLAITPLSEQSVAQGGTLQAFPDFTNGKWMDRAADFATGGY
ncbi:Gfo/Idh/MocA family oxidoreductase [Neolewinella lacunae]|uniref:Gfo/Idh/MocA family oxidoreductase n=1 Tax=Neolewinella lacunae TaxID=1517758 RepID=A0A923PHC6_9BACT|nr:Gfo/Idh/MocA family oxidoreductase [Neolewinella lacunae]MBC6992736.1 Gfo/Idh/MocA family oxidoreductase [Neolewinella lacunae]MDN3635980.1 Gfo/Idh/MocA family oxidoreductase [Neolewinella lacunae]